MQLDRVWRARREFGEYEAREFGEQKRRETTERGKQLEERDCERRESAGAP